MQDKRRGTNYIQPHVSVWHFIHLSRVADYNKVGLFHTHNYRAGDRLYFMLNWRVFCTDRVPIKEEMPFCIRRACHQIGL